MKHFVKFKQTAIAAGVVQVILMASGAAHGQTAADNNAPAPADQAAQVVVTGQRAALESARNIKKNADEIVDSVVAEDIGKLPDKSMTEVLQRVVGVTIDRTLNRADPQQGVGDGIEHFAAEGTGVSIRGMSYVRSELNGRDSFSANGGRALSFEDVPPELMAGVDIYKNPSAEQIEGGIGGLVNLRTAMPFDFKGPRGAFSIEESRMDLRGGPPEPSFSGMLSDRWDTGLGKFGALIDIAHSKIATRANSVTVSPYFPRTDAVTGDTSGQARWVSTGASYSDNDFDRTRDGLYGALQWRNHDVSSGLTYFKSKYQMTTTENAYFVTANPANIQLAPGATFAPNGALLTGTLSDPKDGGLGFGTDSRISGRTSETSDLSWNAVWRASESWTFKADLQHTRATSAGYDNTIGMGGSTPEQGVNLGASPANFTFSQADEAYLADPSNYYWGFTQEHRDQAVGTLNAARIDAKYTFDNPVLTDLRFGLRTTNRHADTMSTPSGYAWTAITQPWEVGNTWQPLSNFAYLSDPRFSGNTSVHTFNNFFGGKLPMPAPIVVPSMSLLAGGVNGTPAGFSLLHTYPNMLCNNGNTCENWSPSPFGTIDGTNQQDEHTHAAYAQLRFDDQQLPYPVDGNVGVRLVHTDMIAAGYTNFTPPTPPSTGQIAGVPTIPGQSSLQSFSNSYTNILPSLNLRMKASDELQFRFAASKGMTRPDFYQMQAFSTLSENVTSHTDPVTKQPVLDAVTFTGSENGNPMLKPTLSNNFDITAEYYFGKSSSLTLALFNKQLKDIIIGRTTYVTLNDTSGQPHDFLITGPVNGASGNAHGLELGYQQYFDKLPGAFSGIGVSANYTYIDSHMDLNVPGSFGQWCTPSGTLNASLATNLYGCDTSGRLLNGSRPPMTGVSKNAMNLALLYDKGPWSARLAYSWRSQYLQAVNAFGTAYGDGIDQNPTSPNYLKPYSVNYALPTWGGSYGQLDLGIHYNVTDNFGIGFEGQNINSAIYRQYMQQGIGMMERSANYTGPRYTLQARYSFE